MITLGIGMGGLIILLIFIDNVWVAAPFLILLGAIGGFLVVPMNALLQHRGHNLMGAGRSIAVQNFNEQAWARPTSRTSAPRWPVCATPARTRWSPTASGP